MGERVWVQVNQGLGRGLWLKVDPYCERGYLIGVPEEGVQESMRQHLPVGGCFYDIGSHIGFYALIAARLVGPHGAVVAFEPDPDNFKLLEENSRRNASHQIVTLPLAIWSRRGKVQFRRSKRSDSSTSSRRGVVVHEGSCNAQGYDLEVDAFALNDYILEARTPDFIKVDVEGEEAGVIEGASRLLEAGKTTFLVEVHHASAADWLVRRFTETGYAIHWLPSAYDAPFPRHLLARPHQSPS